MLMFTDKNQNHIIQIIESNNKIRNASLTDEMYNIAKNTFSGRLGAIRENHEPCINQDWALHFLKETK